MAGYVACLPFEDYENGVIRRHELTRHDTRHDKEEDRMRHFDLCNAQTAAVFLTYRKRPEITALICQLCARLPQESDDIMAGIFADTELRILPYHRLVRDLNGMSPNWISQLFRIVCSIRSLGLRIHDETRDLI